MSNTNTTAASQDAWYAREVTVDWLTWTLIALTIIIQTGALIAYYRYQAVSLVPSTQQTSLRIGVELIALLIAESLGIILIWRAWNHLPKILRTIIRKSILTLLWGSPVLALLTLGRYTTAGIAVLALAALYAGLQLADSKNLLWIIFDVAAIALAAVITGLAGGQLAPRVVVIILVLAMAWDHTAVHLKSWMGELVEFSASTGIPNYIIIPTTLSIDLEDVTDYMTNTGDEKPSGLHGIIGVGDFAIPGMLVISLWAHGTPSLALGSLYGILIATAVLRSSLATTDGALPGLPYLNSGALGGLALAVAASPVPLTALTGGLPL